MAVTDAPLSQLQSLTLDVSELKLVGSGVPDFVIFPAPGSSATTVTIDLLSLQGLNQILTSASVPVGTYLGLTMSYTNPQATDLSGVAQNVQSNGTEINGVLVPPLTVTASSMQSIQVDIDLQRSVIDLGGNNVFLAPVMLLRLVGASQSLPLQGLTGLVTSRDQANDRFRLGLRFNGGALGGGGQIAVQCDGQTSFTDTQGNMSTGGVTATLMAGDLITLDGRLQAGSVIAADSVTLISRPGSGGPITGPPVALIAGTLLSVDSNASTVTLRVSRAFGPPSGGLPAPFQDLTVSVTGNTQIHRGATALTLADLTPGNFARLVAGNATGSVAVDIAELPSRVSGVVTSIQAGAGVNGADRVEFSPAAVNQIPASALSFLPGSLQVDVSANFGLQVGSSIRVLAFFDGSVLLKTLGLRGATGAVPQPPTVPPTASNVLTGRVANGTSASVDSNGDIEFSLQLGGPSGPIVPVLVSQNASLTLTTSAAPLPLTVSQAVSELNSNPSFVEVEGAGTNNGQSFVANRALRIVRSVTLPPQPGPGPGPLPSFTLAGNITGTATLGANNDISFVLNLAGGPLPGPTIIANVTVDPAAQMLVIDRQGGAMLVTAQQAQMELNSGPFAVEVVGSSPFMQGQFTANIALRIFR